MKNNALAVALARPNPLPGHNHDAAGLPTFPVFRGACPKGCDSATAPWPPRSVVVNVGDYLDASLSLATPTALREAVRGHLDATCRCPESTTHDIDCDVAVTENILRAVLAASGPEDHDAPD